MVQQPLVSVELKTYTSVNYTNCMVSIDFCSYRSPKVFKVGSRWCFSDQEIRSWTSSSGALAWRWIRLLCWQWIRLLCWGSNHRYKPPGDQFEGSHVIITQYMTHHTTPQTASNITEIDIYTSRFFFSSRLCCFLVQGHK